MASKLNILLVSAEVAPFAKVGGLADVAGALPRALKALGHDVRIAMPGYPMVTESGRYEIEDVIAEFDVPFRPGWVDRASVQRTSIDGNIPVYLLSSPRWFRDAHDSDSVYSSDPYAYIHFNRTVMEFVPRLGHGWKPHILHCNDWHTGLAPVYLDAYYGAVKEWSRAVSVFTIHNMAFHGRFAWQVFHDAGLPETAFRPERMEDYGGMNCLKGGLSYSRMVNTVSSRYASEITTPAGGHGLDGMLRGLADLGRLRGIVNGIDTDRFDPATDPALARNFDAQDLAGKAVCKAALQREFGLAEDPSAALLAMVTRMTDQKGFDLVVGGLEAILQRPVQLVVLGSGDPRYQEAMNDAARRHPGRVGVWIGYNASLGDRIYGGADIFLMPSLFEPCGLGQMIAMRYGAIPVVREVGGLADTVQDATWSDEGVGYTFSEYSSAALVDAIDRALWAYQHPDKLARVRANAMTRDLSWRSSALEYVRMYRDAMAASPAAEA